MSSAHRTTKTASPSPWPHRVAVLLVCATFPLIWVGGLVTSYDAGMAVPDWPTTYGYNLFLYPWQTWVLGPFDLFIEHGHRLLGALVGVIAIALVLTVWRCDPRRWVLALAVTTLVAVIVQGVIGGARVIENEVQLAKVHGIFGPAFFGLTVAMAVVTSRLWHDAQRLPTDASAGRLHRLAILTTALIFLQLIVGAHLRHLPAQWDPTAFRAVVIFHLILAAALLVHVALLAWRIVRRYRGQSALTVPAMGLAVLLLLQLGLGAAAWVVHYSWPDWVRGYQLTSGHTVQAGGYVQAMTATAHQAMGSLILALGVMLSLRAVRLVRGPAREVSSKLMGVLA